MYLNVWYICVCMCLSATLSIYGHSLLLCRHSRVSFHPDGKKINISLFDNAIGLVVPQLSLTVLGKILPPCGHTWKKKLCGQDMNCSEILKSKL